MRHLRKKKKKRFFPKNNSYSQGFGLLSSFTENSAAVQMHKVKPIPTTVYVNCLIWIIHIREVICSFLCFLLNLKGKRQVTQIRFIPPHVVKDWRQWKTYLRYLNAFIVHNTLLQWERLQLQHCDNIVSVFRLFSSAQIIVCP